MTDLRHRIIVSVALALLGLSLSACNEKRVDHGGSAGTNAAAAEASTARNATQQASDRAAAAAQRLQDATTNATTDKEKEDAVKQYEADRQAIANSTEPQPASGESSPPPQ